MYDGIIFDMDGTIWDSRETIVKAWNEELKAQGIDSVITVSELTGYMGLTMDAIAEGIFPDKKYSETKHIFDKMYERENEYLRKKGAILYPDVISTLKELKKKGYRLFIVSNCQSGYIEAFLEYYKINDYIEDIECFGNNDLPKWDNIALIIKRNNLKNPVYVGDIDNDRIAAGKAGADFIYAEYGFGDVKKYDDIIYRFGDLLRIGEEK